MAAELVIWLNSSDFVDVVPQWTKGVSDDKLEPYLREIQSKFRLSVPAALYTSLNTVARANYKNWSRAKTYSINDRVLWNNRLYSSLTSHSNSEPPNDTNWEELDLWVVWRDYVKPFLIWSTAAMYCSFADKHFSQEGTRRVISPSTDPLTPEELGDMVNKLQSTADRYYLAFREYMDDNSQTIDGTDYKATSSDEVRDYKPKNRIRIV